MTPHRASAGFLKGQCFAIQRGLSMKCPHCKHDHDVKCPSCAAVVVDDEVATIGDDADDVPDDQAEPPVETITPTDEPAPVETETPSDAPQGKKTILEHLLGL